MFACCSAGADDTDLESFYPIRPEYKDEVPVTRFKPRPGKTLSARRWHSSFSEDGRLDIAKVLTRIQSGGVHPSIKGVVWEFLLGCYDPNSTFDERSQLRQERRDQYGAWKAACQVMEATIGSGKLISTPIISEDGRPIQEEDALLDDNKDFSEELSRHTHDDVAETDKKVLQWKLTLHQIGLDVLRTDRTLECYESESNRARLWDILSVYSWIDGDIGYCQGMSDLCSPISILLENEADAFWCFEHLMKRVRENFKCSVGTIGVRSQLGVLSSIMNAIDPKLHQHLEELDGGEYLFAFRMLMVLFRREFSFVDTMYLWELIWAMEYSPNLFSSYKPSSSRKSTESGGAGGAGGAVDEKLLKQCGKFEKKNKRAGVKDQQGTLSIYVVASVLEARNQRLLTEAKGLDDVVKILNDITGNMDAKKACNDALKIHQRYLEKVKKD